MVISKCVPIEISRKKFSKFDESTNPEEMIFVGYKENDDSTKKNIRLHYDTIKEDIKEYVVQYIEDMGGIAPKPEGVEYVEYNGLGAIPIACGILYDEEGTIVTDITKGDKWNESDNSNTIVLKRKLQGFVEINAGGTYTEDYIIFREPVVGGISHVVIDNSGLPLDKKDDETEEVYKTWIPAQETFTLYYGSLNDTPYPAVEILSVPPGCRGVVQILHTYETDVILYSSYAEVQVDDPFVRDVQVTDEDTNAPEDFSPEEDSSTLYVNMNDKKGYVEYKTGEYDKYAFIFSEPELGSSSYIVVDNTGEYYKGYPVTIQYGKYMDENNNKVLDENDIIAKCDVTEIENEKAIIEIFHSLSADIVVKITKL